jgi:hypothetical protein
MKFNIKSKKVSSITGIIINVPVFEVSNINYNSDGSATAHCNFLTGVSNQVINSVDISLNSQQTANWSDDITFFKLIAGLANVEIIDNNPFAKVTMPKIDSSDVITLVTTPPVIDENIQAPLNP